MVENDDFLVAVFLRRRFSDNIVNYACAISVGKNSSATFSYTIFDDKKNNARDIETNQVKLAELVR